MKKFAFIFAALSLFFAFLASCAPEATDVNPFTATRIGGGISSPGGGNSSSSGNGLNANLCDGFTNGTEIEHYGKMKKQFCDERDGKKYVYVTIGIGVTAQTWMAENLNYDAIGSACYDNLESNCTTYGCLYDWATAMDLPSCKATYCASLITVKHRGVCPVGWHIPSKAEWDVLIDYVGGGSSIAGNHLKATNGWNDLDGGLNGNGEDIYGFTALPGGGNSDGYFHGVGILGSWWSTWEGGGSTTYNVYLLLGFKDADWDVIPKSNLFSVRCLQD